jgi:cell division protein FtsA
MSDRYKTSIGLSLGTTSISIAVVHQRPGELPEVMAFDRVPCRFLRDGVIVNLEALRDAVNVCRKNILCVLKTSFSNTTINLCGVHLKQENRVSSLEFKRKREITKRHLSALHQNPSHPEDDSWRLIHNIPVSYTLDSQTGLASPVGMVGKTLQAHVRQIYAPAATVECVLHALSRCGFGISGILVDPLGAAESLITDDEREMGIWILDMGGRVIQLAHLKSKDVFILPSIMPGGDSVDSDIAILLNTTIKDAEKIKIDHGRALTELASNDTKVHIPPLGGGPVQNPTTQHRLAEIIKSRTEELFELASQSISEHSGTERISQGIVLTGGGSMLPGTREIATKYLGLPVIKGHLRHVSTAFDLPAIPLCASAVGLALYGLKCQSKSVWKNNKNSTFTQLFRNIIKWFGGCP